VNAAKLGFSIVVPERLPGSRNSSSLLSSFFSVLFSTPLPRFRASAPFDRPGPFAIPLKKVMRIPPLRLWTKPRRCCPYDFSPQPFLFWMMFFCISTAATPPPRLDFFSPGLVGEYEDVPPSFGFAVSFPLFSFFVLLFSETIRLLSVSFLKHLFGQTVEHKSCDRISRRFLFFSSPGFLVSFILSKVFSLFPPNQRLGRPIAGGFPVVLSPPLSLCFRSPRSR